MAVGLAIAMSALIVLYPFRITQSYLVTKGSLQGAVRILDGQVPTGTFSLSNPARILDCSQVQASWNFGLCRARDPLAYGGILSLVLYMLARRLVHAEWPR